MPAQKLGSYILDHDEKSFYVDQEGNKKEIDYSSSGGVKIDGETKNKLAARTHQNYKDFKISFDELNFESKEEAVEQLENFVNDIADIEISKDNKTKIQNRQMRISNNFDNLSAAEQEKSIRSFIEDEYKDSIDIGTPEILDWERSQDGWGNEIVDIKIKKKYGRTENLNDSIISIHTQSREEVQTGKSNYKVKPHIHISVPKNNDWGKNFCYLRQELSKKLVKHELTASDNIEYQLNNDNYKEYKILKDRLESFSWVVNKHEQQQFIRQQLAEYKRNDNCVKLDNVEQKLDRYLELGGSYDFARKLQTNLKEKLDVGIEVDPPAAYQQADENIKAGNYRKIIDTVRNKALAGEKISERYKEYAKEVLQQNNVGMKEAATAQAIKQVVKNRGYYLDQNWNKVIDRQKLNRVCDKQLNRIKQFEQQQRKPGEIVAADLQDWFVKNNEGNIKGEITHQTDQAILVDNDVWIPKSVIEDQTLKQLEVKEKVQSRNYLDRTKLEADLKAAGVDSVQELGETAVAYQVVYESTEQYIKDNLEGHYKSTAEIKNQIKEDNNLNLSDTWEEKIASKLYDKRQQVKEEVAERRYINQQDLREDLQAGGFELKELTNKSEVAIVYESIENHVRDNIDLDKLKSPEEIREKIDQLEQSTSELDISENWKQKITNNIYWEEIKQTKSKLEDLKERKSQAKQKLSELEGVCNRLNAELKDIIDDRNYNRVSQEIENSVNKVKRALSMIVFKSIELANFENVKRANGIANEVEQLRDWNEYFNQHKEYLNQIEEVTTDYKFKLENIENLDDGYKLTGQFQEANTTQTVKINTDILSDQVKLKSKFNKLKSKAKKQSKQKGGIEKIKEVAAANNFNIETITELKQGYKLKTSYQNSRYQPEIKSKINDLETVFEAHSKKKELLDKEAELENKIEQITSGSSYSALKDKLKNTKRDIEQLKKEKKKLEQESGLFDKLTGKKEKRISKLEQNIKTKQQQANKLESQIERVEKLQDRKRSFSAQLSKVNNKIKEVEQKVKKRTKKQERIRNR